MSNTHKKAAMAAGWQWDDGGPHFYRNAPGAGPFAPYEYAHVRTWKALCEQEAITAQEIKP